MEKFGRYEIISELGRGGMAQVFHAYDPNMKREVAVKVVSREFLHDPKFRTRFQRETQALARSRHPAIVPVYDSGEEDGQPFLVMAFMSGGSLADRLNFGPLPLSESGEIISQLGPALDYAHQHGMIHRDIKPGNILFDEHGNAYLSDFGIVRLSEATVHLTEHGILGTPAYMAPEMADESEPTHLIDIYALGVVVFQMLTGRLPYEATSTMGLMAAHVTKPIPQIHEINPSLPPQIQYIINASLAKDPANRFVSAGALSDALLSVINNGSTANFNTPGTVIEASGMPVLETIAVNSDRASSRLATTIHADDAAGAPTSGSRLPISRVVLIAVAILTTGGLIAAALAASGVLSTAKIDANMDQTQEAEVIVTDSDISASAGEVIDPTPEITEIATNEAAADTEPARDPALVLAESGVGSNAEWQGQEGWPILRDFGGATMTLVPAGCFQMGSDDSSSVAFPAHRVCFEEPFWIDVYEVTNEQYGSWGCPDQSSEPNQPRNCIWYQDASTHCEERGARIPTEAEWEYAARGPDGLTYPWGETLVGANVTYLGNSGGISAVVGKRPGGVSWVGAYDLSGNLWEWVNDWYDQAYYAVVADGIVNPQGPDWLSGEKVMRGGSWGSENLTTFQRDRNDPSNARNDLGFRCAAAYDGS